MAFVEYAHCNPRVSPEPSSQGVVKLAQWTQSVLVVGLSQFIHVHAFEDQEEIKRRPASIKALQRAKRPSALDKRGKP